MKVKHSHECRTLAVFCVVVVVVVSLYLHLSRVCCVSTLRSCRAACPVATWLALAVRLRRLALTPTPTGTAGPRTKPLEGGEENIPKCHRYSKLLVGFGWRKLASRRRWKAQTHTDTQRHTKSEDHSKFTVLFSFFHFFLEKGKKKGEHTHTQPSSCEATVLR